MPLTAAQKIIAAHIVEGEMKPGNSVGLRIDETLTQDATGTMAYLEFETMGVDRVRTKRSVAYIDHNTLQCGFENADDHRFIRTVAKKHGIWYSRPGNGICHQVHLERFGIPGETLIGSDSHTPTCGALGMLAIGAGGMDVAVAMAGGPYYIDMPLITKVYCTGTLPPFVAPKDAGLKLLQLISVKGGVGRIMEWCGPGVDKLTVPERATIANIGAELGATTTVFPSDEQTKKFLTAQGRGEEFTEILPDEDAVYDDIIEINFDELVPLAACPDSPDAVVPVSELKDIAVNQVCIGSCTNSSLLDMKKTAGILKGKTINDNVSLTISPGSRQVLQMITKSGELTDILGAGGRLLECACGPCIGMGASPESAGVSLRTFNRNFKGRSGTADAKVYLVSPETAAASALTGFITDPRSLKDYPVFTMPETFDIDDSGVIAPASPEEASAVTVERGPNIKPFPVSASLSDSIEVSVSLKVGDNITTDHIMPAGAKILPYRSNIPKLSEFCFTVCDENFPVRAKAMGNSVIIGGNNYGQGSSREHAALVPMYLGVRCVIAKSFARIHRANLINSGIIPLEFSNPDDYDLIDQNDEIKLSDLISSVKSGNFTLKLKDKNKEINLKGDFTERQQKLLLAGGLANIMKPLS